MRRFMPVMVCLVLLDQISLSILFPILPLLFSDASSSFFILSDASLIPTVGHSLLSWMYGIFPLAQFIAAPLLGQLSDVYGRRRVLIICACLIAGAYLVLVLGIVAKLVSLVIIARILSGVGAGSLGVIFAAAGDGMSVTTRAKRFGYISAAAGAGLVIGPALGALLSNSHLFSWFNTLTPIYCVCLFGLLNALLVFLFLPETSSPRIARRVVLSASFQHIVRALEFSSVRVVYFASFLLCIALSLFVAFSSLLVLERFSISQTMLSILFVYIGLCIVITQVVLVPLALRLANAVVILRDAFLTAAFGFVVLYFAPSFLWVLISIPLIAAGLGLAYTMIPTLLSRYKNHNQGELQGINASIQSLAQTSPIMFGVLPVVFSAEVPILVAVCVSAVAGIYVFTTRSFYQDA